MFLPGLTYTNSQSLNTKKNVFFLCYYDSMFVFCIRIHKTLPLPLWDFIKQGSLQLRPSYNSSSFHLSTSISVFLLLNHINSFFFTIIYCPSMYADLARLHSHCCGWIVFRYYVRRKKVKQSTKTMKTSFTKNLIVSADLHLHRVATYVCLHTKKRFAVQ